jgi:hypothetical protein
MIREDNYIGSGYFSQEAIVDRLRFLALIIINLKLDQAVSSEAAKELFMDTLPIQ